MNATYSIASPPLAHTAGNAAISIVEIAGDVDAVLGALGVASIAPPRAALRRVPDVDTLVIARPAHDRAFVFPHAGPVIVRKLTSALERCGVSAAIGPIGPIATDHLAAALARAASPLAIDLLLDQPRRFADPEIAPVSSETARQLNRLIDPPLVVALGPPNIGKSSLLNALAGRTVAIVADEPGTTRDHVGALIDFAGLVVRYVDAPGIGPPSQREGVGGRVHFVSAETGSQSPAGNDHAIQAEAQRLALAAAVAADLVLVCGDRGSGFPVTAPTRVPSVRVALRADLGLPRPNEFDLAVSVKLAEETPHTSYRTHMSHSARGLATLVAAVREQLVPAAALADQGAWVF